MIAEFGGPVEAVLAEVEFQRKLKARNLACATRDQMLFRLCFNLDDVIMEVGDESVELLAVGIVDTITSKLMKSSALQEMRAEGNKVLDPNNIHQGDSFVFNADSFSAWLRI